MKLLARVLLYGLILTGSGCLAQQINLATQVRGILQPVNGGLGVDASHLTGCWRVNSGVATVSAANCLLPLNGVVLEAPTGNQILTQPAGTGLYLFGQTFIQSLNYAPSSTWTYVATGDSTCAGYLQPSPSTGNWPYQLSQLPYMKNRYALQQNCVVGQTPDQWLAAFSTQVAPFAPNGTTITQLIATAMIGRNGLNNVSGTEGDILSWVNQVKALNGSNGTATPYVYTILPSSTSPIGPLGAAQSVTSVSQTNTGTSGVATITGTGFTATAGQYVYFPPSLSITANIANGFSTTATVTTPTCAAATVTQTTTTNAHVTCSASTTGFNVGQPVLIGITDGGLSGTAAYLNNNYYVVAAQSGSTLDLATGPTTTCSGGCSTSGNIYNSTGVGFPLNNNVLQVLASPAPTSTSLSFATGPEWPYANTASAATVYVVSYPGWDSITPTQEQNRQAINAYIRQNFPNNYIEAGNLFFNANSTDCFIDGTHESSACSALIAQHSEGILAGGGQETTQVQPIGNMGAPAFPFEVQSTSLLITGNDQSQMPTGPSIRFYVTPTYAAMDCQTTTSVPNLGCIYSGSFHTWNIGRTTYASLTTNGFAATHLTDSSLAVSTSPICANGTGGAFVNSGCGGGGLLAGGVTLSPGSLSAGSCVSNTATITGAAVGHAVAWSLHGAVPSVPSAPYGVIFASVTAANTVTAEFCSLNSSYNYGTVQLDLSTF